MPLKRELSKNIKFHGPLHQSSETHALHRYVMVEVHGCLCSPTYTGPSNLVTQVQLGTHLP